MALASWQGGAAFIRKSSKHISTCADQIFTPIISCLAACIKRITCWQETWDDPFIIALENEPIPPNHRPRDFRRALAPEPLPKVRPRALSLPSQDASAATSTITLGKAPEKDGAVVANWMERQSQSPLLGKLAAEVRIMIYQYLISNSGQSEVFHILSKEKRIGYWQCRRSADGQPCDWNSPCCPAWLPYKNSWTWAIQAGEKNGSEQSLITDGDVLPFMMSCRMVYYEALPLLYSRPIFHFPDPGTVPHFADGILPHRLSLIQRLEMDWEGAHSIYNPGDAPPRFDDEEMDAWIAAWSAISRMTGLQELRVTLKLRRFMHVQNRRKAMVEPMMHIRGLRVFELAVEWNEHILRAQLGNLVEKAPFTIKQVGPRLSNGARMSTNGARRYIL